MNDYASDVIVLKLYCSNIFEKLLELIKSGSEDPLNIVFMAMSLYFLMTFLCTFNGDGATFSVSTNRPSRAFITNIINNASDDTMGSVISSLL